MNRAENSSGEEVVRNECWRGIFLLPYVSVYIQNKYKMKLISVCVFTEIVSTAQTRAQKRFLFILRVSVSTGLAVTPKGFLTRF